MVGQSFEAWLWYEVVSEMAHLTSIFADMDFFESGVCSLEIYRKSIPYDRRQTDCTRFSFQKSIKTYIRIRRV